MDISIIIRTKEQLQFLRVTLPMIWGQETSFSFEVVIVDSGSSPQTLDALKRLCQGRPLRLVQIPAEEFGFAKALAMGIEAAEGNYAVSLSGDAVPADAHWLENLVAPLQRDGVGCVYGRQIPRSDAGSLERWKLNKRYPEIAEAGVHHHISNANSAFPRSLAVRFPFDPALPYCEDYDWARRIRKAGYLIVYQPDAVVVHSHSTNLYQQVKRILAFRAWRFIIDHWRPTLEERT